MDQQQENYNPELQKPASEPKRSPLKQVWSVLWGGYQVILSLLLVCIILTVILVANYTKVFHIIGLKSGEVETSSFMEIERIKMYENFSAGIGKKGLKYTWIDFDSIPELLRDMVVIAEDAKFYKHSGFDLNEIEYAIVANHQQGKAARGASTITQQLAKNMYLSSEKSMSRKLHEAVITVLMEEFMAKERILEVYLNVAQYAPGVFGVREGAKYHFGKNLNELTMEEMIALAAVLPSPNNWYPGCRTSAFYRHKNQIARNYALFKKLISPSDMDKNEWRYDALNELAHKVDQQGWENLQTKASFKSKKNRAMKNPKPKKRSKSSSRKQAKKNKFKERSAPAKDEEYEYVYVYVDENGNEVEGVEDEFESLFNDDEYEFVEVDE